ncbi:MAG: hypothetical protein ACYSUQ_08650 [Planctomycetota bacterium]
MIRRVSPVGLVLASLVVGGCGEDRLTLDEIVGEYAMVRVDDSGLPVVVRQTETRTEEITGGRLTLLPSSEYTMTVDFRITLDALSGPILDDSTFIDVGPLTIGQDYLIMETTTPGLILYGTVSGSSITVGLPREGPNHLLTYRR